MASPSHDADAATDSLRREHAASDETSTERSTKRQKRAGVGKRKAACQSCRMRKIKCDRARPACYICRSSGIDCHYLHELSSTLTLQTATERILNRIDQLQTELSGPTPASISTGPLPSDRHDRTASTSSQQQSERHVRTLSASSQKTAAGPEFTTLEPSRDFLQIPPHRTSADSVLCWEVFDGRYPPNALIGALFPSVDDARCESAADIDQSVFSLSGKFYPLQEERIPSLIDNFLQNVHTKNPILDVEMLVKEGRQAAQQGIGWDAPSCLALLACALGSVAKPFAQASSSSPAFTQGPGSTGELAGDRPYSKDVFSRELEHGDSCFLLAARRLGALRYTLLGAQCHFFAGVYLMYTMRPLLSWQYFYHASILYQLHLKTIHGVHGAAGVLEIPDAHLNAMDRKRRRLEQSLYWSCFKSECEFRVELPLPQSEFAGLQHPNLFPSPPSPMGAALSPGLSPLSAGYHALEVRTHSSGAGPAAADTATETLMDEVRLKLHSKQLCREEESWYYYLTEIALRRIGNRIINTFFRQDQGSWLDVQPLLRLAQEFDVQVSSWSANLPPAMKHYEATSTIKAPMRDAAVADAENSVSRELSWATDNRILEMRSWLYQPFLYFLIHTRAVPQASSASSSSSRARSVYPVHASEARNNIDRLLNPISDAGGASTTLATSRPEVLSHVGGLDADELVILSHMITSGIECNLRILDVRSLRHRHHGLWYDLRSLMCASLILLGLVKAGFAALIPGGPAVLWGPGATTGRREGWPIQGKIGSVLQQFEFWAGEAPELLRHRDVLVQLTDEIRRRYQLGE